MISGTLKYKMEMKRLLFVCSGNSCRSVMAEYIMKDLCKKQSIKMEIFSRGINPEEEVNQYTIGVLKNSEVKQHVPKRLEQEDISLSDLILTMDKPTKAKIIIFYPNILENLEKVYTLKEILGHNDPNIEDPYSNQFIIKNGRVYKNKDEDMIIDRYKKCNNYILECLKELIKKKDNMVLPKNNFADIVGYYMMISNTIKKKDLINEF